MRQELSTCHAKRQVTEQQSQQLLRDNGLMLADLQKAAPAAQEAESLRQEVQNLRATLEYEQKSAAHLRDTMEALKEPYGKAAVANGYGEYSAIPQYIPQAQAQAQVSTRDATSWAAQVRPSVHLLSDPPSLAVAFFSHPFCLLLSLCRRLPHRRKLRSTASRLPPSPPPSLPARRRSGWSTAALRTAPSTSTQPRG